MVASLHLLHDVLNRALLGLYKSPERHAIFVKEFL
jgi:hypothetical protein